MLRLLKYSKFCVDGIPLLMTNIYFLVVRVQRFSFVFKVKIIVRQNIAHAWQAVE